MKSTNSLQIGNLKPPEGSRRNRKILGRGQGSGNGGTSGKGHKGQNSRSGGKRPASFEGGQMPLQMRLPKRGFCNIFRIEYQVINLDELGRFDGEVTLEVLQKSRLVKNGAVVKILGGGNISKALTVHAAKFSKSAKKKIEDAGGKAVEVK